MPYNINLTANALFTVPGGYPLVLSTQGELYANGILPKGIESVLVDAYTPKSALLHVAILDAPTTSGGADGSQVVDLDTNGDVTKTYQEDTTLALTESTTTLELPTTKAPAVYVLRIWADEIEGLTDDTEDHDTSTTGTQSIKIPNAVYITKISVT